MHPRTERLRQDDAPLGDVRPARADGRPDPDRRLGRHRAAAGGDRDDLPGREPAAVAQPAPEPRVPVRDQAPQARRAADQSAARRDRPRGFRERLSARALRRHAAAGVDRARARAGSGGAADGRAVRRARRVHARRDEPAPAAVVVGDRQDDRLRHPQHQRGDLPRRPRRRDDASAGPRRARCTRSTCRARARSR